MAKRERAPLSWTVKNYCCNSNSVFDYDILEYREYVIKKIKKNCNTKEEFSQELQSEMAWKFRSRVEYEICVSIDEEGRVWLIPFCGCVNPDAAKIEVTHAENFDWVGFAKHHIENQIYKNYAKIDVYDQLQWKWEEFVNYCWEYRHKYQRSRKT